MQVALHGTSALKVLALLGANYLLCKAPYDRIPKRVFPVVLWVFNMAILFLNEAYDGYRYGSVHSAFSFLVSYTTVLNSADFNLRTNTKACSRDGTSTSTSPCFVSCPLAWITIGLAALLLHHRQHHHPYVQKVTTTSLLMQQTSTYRQRIIASHPIESYSFANYIAYALYPPLYIAGPIISFNDFLWQVWCRFSSALNPLTRISWKNLCRSLADRHSTTPSVS